MEKIEKSPGCLIDTGVLVAYLIEGEEKHQRAAELIREFQVPLKTCEAVISEAVFLIRSRKGNPAYLFELAERGIFQIDFRLQDHIKEINYLLKKYDNIPISLADACLIRCAEIYNEPRILTLDLDFKIYRWGKNKKFQVLD